MFNKNKAQYSHLSEVLLSYWKSYGGMKTFLCSPYLHITIFLSLVMWPIWTQPNWWELVISILPSVVGFSLGGYAIFTAFGNEDFKYAISGIDANSKKTKKYSPFIQANASFLHFIIVQLVALIFAVLAQARIYHSLPSYMKGTIEEALTVKGFFVIDAISPLLWFLSFSLFVYALSLAFAATFAIFRMALWFDESVTIQKKIEKNSGKK